MNDGSGLHKSHRLWWSIGCALGLLMVAGGAFGAHALEARLDRIMLERWDTGARYGATHALALLVALLASERLGPAAAAAAPAFALGVLLFTGSLWAMALSGLTLLGAITPLGGLCFMVGWAVLLRAAWTSR
jgi:uncharacterized membrane protein YgdD (TMEM256/DUF423 family)